MRAEKRIVIFIVKELWFFYWKEVFESNLFNCLQGLMSEISAYLKKDILTYLYFFETKRRPSFQSCYLKNIPDMNENRPTFSHTDFARVIRRNEVEMSSNVWINDDFTKRPHNNAPASGTPHPTKPKTSCVKDLFLIIRKTLRPTPIVNPIFALMQGLLQKGWPSRTIKKHVRRKEKKWSFLKAECGI